MKCGEIFNLISSINDTKNESFSFLSQLYTDVLLIRVVIINDERDDWDMFGMPLLWMHLLEVSE